MSVLPEVVLAGMVVRASQDAVDQDVPGDRGALDAGVLDALDEQSHVV